MFSSPAFPLGATRRSHQRSVLSLASIIVVLGLGAQALPAQCAAIQRPAAPARKVAPLTLPDLNSIPRDTLRSAALQWLGGKMDRQLASASPTAAARSATRCQTAKSCPMPVIASDPREREPMPIETPSTTDREPMPVFPPDCRNPLQR